MMEHSTYIVTGGAGFIGSNLVAALLARTPRPQVIVIDNFRSGSFANIVEACQRAEVEPFDGEVIVGSSSSVDFERLLSGMSPATIFHLGAVTDTTVSNEAEMMRENVANFRELMHACEWRRVPLVYASSAATYGSPAQARDRVPFPLGAAGQPNNIYGFSKWMMECAHWRFSTDHVASGGAEPQIVGLRYFNVYGPGEARKGKMASMVYQLGMQMLAGDRPRIFSDGSQARDQVYVDDVVECTLAAAGLMRSGGPTPRPPRPGVYNLGSGETTSFNQIVVALREGLGISETQLPTDYFEMPEHIRAFYQDYTCADMSETASGLDWKPQWKPADAIAKYAAMLRR